MRKQNRSNVNFYSISIVIYREYSIQRKNLLKLAESGAEAAGLRGVKTIRAGFSYVTWTESGVYWTSACTGGINSGKNSEILKNE